MSILVYNGIRHEVDNMFEFPFDYLMFVNAALILLFVFVLYRGYKVGMLLQIVNLFSSLVAGIIAWLFADVFASIYQFVDYNKTGFSSMNKFLTDHANQLIWFFILFVVIRILMIVLKPIAAMISKIPLIKQVNSVMGGVFSIVTYVVYLIMIIYFLSLPIIKNGTDIINNSFLKNVDDMLHPVISIIDEKIEENESIQYMLAEKELTVSQKQSMVDLLSKNGFSNEEIREFLLKYHE